MEVIEYRNSIAHAKTILENDYFKMKRLFEKINEELSSAIEMFVNSQQHNPINIDFNNYLYSILEEDMKSKRWTFDYLLDDENLVNIGFRRIGSKKTRSKEDLLKLLLESFKEEDKED